MNRRKSQCYKNLNSVSKKFYPIFFGARIGLYKSGKIKYNKSRIQSA